MPLPVILTCRIGVLAISPLLIADIEPASPVSYPGSLSLLLVGLPPSSLPGPSRCGSTRSRVHRHRGGRGHGSICRFLHGGSCRMANRCWGRFHRRARHLSSWRRGGGGSRRGRRGGGKLLLDGCHISHKNGDLSNSVGHLILQVGDLPSSRKGWARGSRGGSRGPFQSFQALQDNIVLLQSCRGSLLGGSHQHRDLLIHIGNGLLKLLLGLLNLIQSPLNCSHSFKHSRGGWRVGRLSL